MNTTTVVVASDICVIRRPSIYSARLNISTGSFCTSDFRITTGCGGVVE
jgi:hypothetical protein